MPNNFPLDPETARRLREKGHIDDATFQRFGFEMPVEGPEPAPAGYQSNVDYATLMASPDDEENAEAFGRMATHTPPFKDNFDKIDELGLSSPTPTIPASQSASRANPGELEALAANLKAEKEAESVALASNQPATTEPLTVDAANIAGQQVNAAEAPFAMAGMTGMQGFDLMEQGIIQEAAAGKAQAAKEASYLDEQANQANLRIQKMEDEQQQRQTDMDEAQAKYQQVVDDMATMKVDKNRLWAKMGSGDKVLAGIGMFLGAFGSSDSNLAVKVINDSIERDIREQESNIQMKGTEVSNRRGLLSDMLSRFNSERQAKLATHAAYLQNAEFEVQKYAAKYKGTAIAGKAMQLAGQLQTKKAEFLGKLYKEAAERQNIQQTGGLKPQEVYAQSVPGYDGIVPTKGEAAKFREGLADVESAKRGIDRLLEIGSKGSSLSPSDRTEAFILVKSLQSKLRTEVLGPGAVTDTEWGILNSMVANPTNIWSLASQNKKALSTLKGNLEKNLNEKAKSLNLRKRGQLSTIGAPD